MLRLATWNTHNSYWNARVQIPEATVQSKAGRQQVASSTWVLVTCVGEPSRVPDSYAQPPQTLEVKMSCWETCVSFLIKDNLFLINTW